MAKKEPSGSKWTHSLSCRCEKCKPDSQPPSGGKLSHDLHCRCVKCR